MRFRIRIALALVLNVCTAFRAAQTQAQGGISRTNRGDTTVIVTSGAGRVLHPKEVLRVSGDTRETTFGSAYEIQATPDGGVIIFDTRSLDGMVARQFDANGKFVRNLGRSGPGPGEYVRPNLTIAVHTNGSVYLRDDDKSVSIFGRDGKLISTFPLNFGNGSTTEIVAADDGSVYIRAPSSGASVSPSVPRAMYHYSPKGQLLDSISSMTRWLPDGAAGHQAWRPLPDGRLLFTRTDKVAFMIVDRARKQRPLIVEGPGGPVPYLAAERAELQAARDLQHDKCPRVGRGATPRVTIPEMKLPARGGVKVDVNGRIWIPRSATAQKVASRTIVSCSSSAGSFRTQATYEEPPVFAGFASDGTYLGEIRFPLKARVTFVGNMAWALVPDDDDVPLLVKYRLY